MTTKHNIMNINSFLEDLFKEELSNEKRYDQDAVRLVEEHLLKENVHTQAGKRLAESLVELAKKRAEENSK